MFVRFIHPDNNQKLYGKLTSSYGTLVTVEYLMDPLTGSFDIYEARVKSSQVERFEPKENDTVYAQSRNGVWNFGFLKRNARTALLGAYINGELCTPEETYLLSKFINDKSNRYLQNLVLSPRKSVLDRSNFFKSYTQQRALAYGVESSISSLLILEEHQLNVAKRVLEDPLRRYILADEVGLGKTIEAGFVIRQTMLDQNFKARVCIVCPETLIKQWSSELSDKFQLNLFLFYPSQLGLPISAASIEIVSYEALKHDPGDTTYDLVIIDEAHKVMPREIAAISGELFSNTLALTRNAKSVLLLSATPALHNELGFLSMLSVVDPISYNVNQLANFKKKIDRRIDVAELIAGLSPSNLFLLDSVIDRIRGLFADSPELNVLLDDFEDYVLDVVDETDPTYLSKLRNLRSHLSEAYKLNHRVIKNRRKNLSFVTQNRSGVSSVSSADNYGNFANFNDLLEEWSIQHSTETDTSKLKNYSDMHFQLRERIYRYYSGNFGQFGFYATNPNFVGNVEQFKQLMQQLRSNRFFNERVITLKRLLDREFHDRAKFVIFTTCSDTADQIYNVLSSHFDGVCYRHKTENEDWKAFVERPFQSILVCDASAEEGLNIQGRNRSIIHFDLPLNVNRIEQRIGRIDRYGGEDAVKSFVILNRADQFEVEWAKLLKSGVKIFDQSVASLQYLIEDHLSGEEFKLQLLGRRTEYITAKKRELQGEHGLIANALKQLQHEDKLEEIADPPEDIFYDLKIYDERAEDIQESCDPWLCNQLQLSKEIRTQAIFEYNYVSNPRKNTLLNREWLSKIKAFEAKATGVTNPVFTFNREAGSTTTGQKPSILRYGNTFLNSIFSTSRLLPIGKSSLTWVFQPILNQIFSEPLIVLKSHVIIEADIAKVGNAINSWEDYRFKLTSDIIRRRCDALYPPKFKIVSNASISDISENLTVSSLLNGLDEIETSNIFKSEGFKFDLSSKNLTNFYNNFSHAQDWFDLVLELTKAASAQIITDHIKLFDHQIASYRNILDKRLNRYKAILDGPTLDLEERINEQLLAAVRRPKIRFIASEALVLTSNSKLTRQLMTGEK